MENVRFFDIVTFPALRKQTEGYGSENRKRNKVTHHFALLGVCVRRSGGLGPRPEVLEIDQCKNRKRFGSVTEAISILLGLAQAEPIPGPFLRSGPRTNLRDVCLCVCLSRTRKLVFFTGKQAFVICMCLCVCFTNTDFEQNG